MSVSERVRAVVEPVVAAADVELFDLEQAGPVLRVTIDRPGGVDVDVVASVTRALSRALDEHDPIAGQYTLEVSSPGLERSLRTEAHYRWAVGRQVAIKTLAGTDGGRRLTGTLTEADPTGVVVRLDDPLGEDVRLAYRDIERARTVFVWGPTPKPGGPGSKAGRSAKASARTTPATPSSGAPPAPTAPAEGPSTESSSGTEVQAS